MTFCEVLPVIPKDVKLPSLAEFVNAEKADFLYERLKGIVGEPGTQFDIDKNGIPARTTIDCFIQKVLPAILHPAVLYYVHNALST